MSKLIKNYIWVFFISMLPIVELRGAVPRGVGLGLPFKYTYLVSILGNMVPVPFIMLLWEPVLHLMGKIPFLTKAVDFILEKGHKAGAKLKGGKYLALLRFVAIPLPGTGAWTGSFAAALLGMDFKKSFLRVLAGVAVAGIIMGIVSYGAFGIINLAA
jgi:uncharacterized membrane protein